MERHREGIRHSYKSQSADRKLFERLRSEPILNELFGALDTGLRPRRIIYAQCRIIIQQRLFIIEHEMKSINPSVFRIFVRYAASSERRRTGGLAYCSAKVPKFGLAETETSTPARPARNWELYQTGFTRLS